MLTRRIDGQYGLVELDHPPVNAIGQEMRQALLDAVDWAEAEGLERVILSGKGRAFAAGADAREFDSDPEPPHLPDVLNRIEASHVPWIAAIHGACLGGGLELALACRYRIAHPAAVLGLPEVTLGVVPGAGGTQRLPRLIGLDAALELIPTGKTVSGAKARALGLVHDLDEDPADAAGLVNGEWLRMAVPVGELNTGEGSDGALVAARAAADRRMRGQVAPRRAIDLLELARTAPLAEGLAEERRAFLDLRQSDQAQALRHVFFAERGARAPEGLAEAPHQVSRAAVVGGGTMGAGIAYALLGAGIEVTLLEAEAEAVTRAEANVDRLIEDGMRRGRLDADGAAALRGRFAATQDYGRGADVDIAIEAVFEDMGVKKQVFGQLQQAVPASAILATNTSYLDVNEIARSLEVPPRLLGLHFFAPAHVMKLLEIVRGDATSDRALATGFALAKRLKKIPVLAGVCDGFIGNRILTKYRDAADHVMMDGSNPWEIDEAMVDFGYAMGPYEVQDLSGLDIAFANRRRKDASRDPQARYVPIADRMVNEGRLGRKAGVGWYRYPGGGGKVIDPLVEDLVREEAHFAGVARREFTADEIRHRLLLAMINEAANILHEGIAARASDIDLVTIHGYGFPRWRGGLMHHADSLGAAAVLDGLEALAREDPLFWAPSPLVRDCAVQGGQFADWTRGEG